MLTRIFVSNLVLNLQSTTGDLPDITHDILRTNITLRSLWCTIKETKFFNFFVEELRHFPEGKKVSHLCNQIYLATSFRGSHLGSFGTFYPSRDSCKRISQFARGSCVFLTQCHVASSRRTNSPKDCCRWSCRSRACNDRMFDRPHWTYTGTDTGTRRIWNKIIYFPN